MRVQKEDHGLLVSSDKKKDKKKKPNMLNYKGVKKARKSRYANLEEAFKP